MLDRLSDYTGVRDGWALEVHNGVVTIRGRFTEAARAAIIVQLARTVPGVLRVHVEDAGPRALSTSPGPGADADRA